MDATGASHDVTSAQATSDEALVMRRLEQADEWVRANWAEAEEGAVRLRSAKDDDSVVVRVPLPPSPLIPSFEVRLSLADVPPEAATALYSATGGAIRPALPGSLETEVTDEAAVYRWTPRPAELVVEAGNRARAIGEQMVLMARDLAAGVPPHEALDGLAGRIEVHQCRGEVLSHAFPEHIMIRLPGVGLAHQLAYVGPVEPGAGPRLVVHQMDADLLSPQAGRGFRLVLRLPGWTDGARPTALAQSLVEITARRLGLSLEITDDRTGLDDWAGCDGVLVFGVPEHPGASFDGLVDSLGDLVRFATSFVELTTRGHNPFDLLGVTDPGPEPPASPVEPVPGDEGGPALSPPKPRLPTPEPARRSLPDIEWPPPAASAVPRKAERPDLDRLSAREVVKRLGMQEAAEMDVFLSHPGYNPQKTVDILSIALSMTKERAQEIVDSAPCLVLGPVTRTRAAQIKTILEGTGSTIRVIPTGQSEDSTE